MTTRTPALIALDWGTSSLRAYLMAPGSTILDERSSEHGIQHLPEPGVAGFEAAFEAIAGSWLDAHGRLPVVAGGMVGSAQGWAAAPYVRCPADLGHLAEAAASVETRRGVRILIAPGVLYDPPGGVPDVLRGEEIEIAGALTRRPEWRGRCRAVLPGTHSKWVDIEDGRIIGFDTYMTGEIFSLLAAHSILGRLLPQTRGRASDPTGAAFEAGLAAAAGPSPAALTHALFAVRTLGLTGRMRPEDLPDYLSGLLIGHELAAATRGDTDGTPILLIGDGGLCRRYAAAFAALGLPLAATLGASAPYGLHGFARAVGLLPIEEMHDA